MIKSLRAFVANESGATAIEYALIASLIAVALGHRLERTWARASARNSAKSAACSNKPSSLRELQRWRGRGPGQRCSLFGRPREKGPVAAISIPGGDFPVIRTERRASKTIFRQRKINF